MPRIALSARFVAALNPIQTLEFWDLTQPGLVLRAGPRSKTWSVVFRLNGTKHRRGIGSYPEIGLEAARKMARQMVGTVAGGEDPVAIAPPPPPRGGLTVADLADRYLREHAYPQKRSAKEDDRLLRVNILPLIGTIRLDVLTRVDIRRVITRHQAEGHQVAAARTLAVIRKALSFAVENDLIATNPAAGIKVVTPQSRDRVLIDDELTSVARDLAAGRRLTREMADLLLLCLLTGARAGEAAGITQAEIQGDQWHLSGARTKNKRPHIVPLHGLAMDIVTRRRQAAIGDYLFSVTGNAPFTVPAISRAVRRAFPATGWTPHDLRRSMATGMAAIAVPVHVIEASINHVSGSRAGVAGIYNRHSYLPERSAALAQWAAHIERIIADG